MLLEGSAMSDFVMLVGALVITISGLLLLAAW